MPVRRAASVATAVISVLALVGLSRPASAEAVPSKTYTVSVRALCHSFHVANSGFTCRGGYAESSGALHKYTVKVHTQFVHSDLFLNARKTTCSSLSFQYWDSYKAQTNHIGLKILSVSGTKRSTSTGNAMKSITAKVKKAPFRVSVIDPHETYSTNLYLNGSATCTTATGTRAG